MSVIEFMVENLGDDKDMNTFTKFYRTTKIVRKDWV